MNKLGNARDPRPFSTTNFFIAPVPTIDPEKFLDENGEYHHTFHLMASNAIVWTICRSRALL